MPSPTTPVLDTFTGTNGVDLPVYSANWSAITGLNNLEIQGNAATASAGNSANYWNAQNFGPPAESHCTMSVKPPDGFNVSIFVRAKDETNITTLDAYDLFFSAVAGTDTWVIRRIDNGTATQLGAAVSQEAAAGDGMWLEAFDSRLTGYRRSSGVWTSLLSRTDATYGAAGKIMLLIDSTTTRVDDFGGGNIYNPPIFNSEWFAFG
jgi:hypothetical protein